MESIIDNLSMISKKLIILIFEQSINCYHINCLITAKSIQSIYLINTKVMAKELTDNELAALLLTLHEFPPEYYCQPYYIPLSPETSCIEKCIKEYMSKYSQSQDIGKQKSHYNFENIIVDLS